MQKIETVEGWLCSSSYGNILYEKKVEVDLKTYSFPIPEDIEMEDGIDYTVGVKLHSTTITMDLTISDDEKSFTIEDSMDQSWLDYYASGRMSTNEKESFSSSKQ